MFILQGQRRQRSSNIMRGQHLPRVGGDSPAGGRVGGRLRDVTLALPAATPARDTPTQAPVHAALEAYEVGGRFGSDSESKFI